MKLDWDSTGAQQVRDWCLANGVRRCRLEDGDAVLEIELDQAELELERNLRLSRQVRAAERARLAEDGPRTTEELQAEAHKARLERSTRHVRRQ